MRVRVIPNLSGGDGNNKIRTVRLIRTYGRLSLKGAKDAMDYGHPFTLCDEHGETGFDAGLLDRFFAEAAECPATVVVGEYPVPPLPTYQNLDGTVRQADDGDRHKWGPDVLAEVKAMRRELAALRFHLGQAGK